jgi:hypothetical protein
MAVCAAIAAAPAAAGAQEPAPLTKVMSVTGKSGSGKQFRGTYAIDHFRASSGRLVAVGTLRGRLGERRVSKRGVTMSAALSEGPAAAQLPPIPNACGSSISYSGRYASTCLGSSFAQTAST